MTHPNILKIYMSGQRDADKLGFTEYWKYEDGKPETYIVTQKKNLNYLVMELGGKDLGKLMESYPDQKVPEQIAKTIVQQILMGLEFLHNNLITHLDLKP